MLKNKGNRFAQIFKTCVARGALPIRTWNLSAVGDMPRAVLLHYRCKLVAHTHTLPPVEATPASIAPDHQIRSGERAAGYDCTQPRRRTTKSTDAGQLVEPFTSRTEHSRSDTVRLLGYPERSQTQRD